MIFVMSSERVIGNGGEKKERKKKKRHKMGEAKLKNRGPGSWRCFGVMAIYSPIKDTENDMIEIPSDPS